MEFYGQSNVATVPSDHSPTWIDAVNSEFYYDQHRKQDIAHLKNTTHMYPTTNGGVANSTFNLPGHMLAMATTPVDSMQKNVDYYQQQPTTPMEYGHDDSYLSPALTSSLYSDDSSTAIYAPCQGPPPWNFAPCYGYYGQAPCSLVNIIDMEDFM